MKYIAALTILFGGFFWFQTFTYADTPIQVVRKEVKYIENDNTVLYSKLWVRSMQNAVLFHHSDNIRNQDTLRNVTSSSLVKAKPPRTDIIYSKISQDLKTKSKATG